MPRSWGEWAIFGLGLALAAFFVVLTVRGHDSGTPTAQSGGVLGATTAATVTTQATTPSTHRTVARPLPTSPVTTSAPVSTETGTTPAQAPVELSLTAARGDAWFEVRAGSPTAAVLFSGILLSQSTRRFSGTKLWIRFGAAGNLDARLNGKPLPLPIGTYDATIVPAGLRR